MKRQHPMQVAWEALGCRCESPHPALHAPPTGCHQAAHDSQHKGISESSWKMELKDDFGAENFATHT